MFAIETFFMWVFTHQWVFGSTFLWLVNFNHLTTKRTKKNLVWFMQKIFMKKKWRKRVQIFRIWQWVWEKHVTKNVTRYLNFFYFLLFFLTCSSQIDPIPLVDWCPVSSYTKTIEKRSKETSMVHIIAPFTQNNNWKFRRKTLDQPPSPKTHNPKFEAPIPLPRHTTPPPQKGPKRLTQGPSSPTKNKRNKTHMKLSNKWGNFPLPWKVLERDP